MVASKARKQYYNVSRKLGPDRSVCVKRNAIEPMTLWEMFNERHQQFGSAEAPQAYHIPLDDTTICWGKSFFYFWQCTTRQLAV